MYVKARDNMKLETLINCILHALEYIGGVPLSLSFDNMKTVVIEVEWPTMKPSFMFSHKNG